MKKTPRKICSNKPVKVPAIHKNSSDSTASFWWPYWLCNGQVIEVKLWLILGTFYFSKTMTQYDEILQNDWGQFFCYSDMRSVANHLCQEFMSDIIRVTGSSDDDDTAPLQNYLLRERGWLLLYTIHKNGTQVEHYSN